VLRRLALVAARLARPPRRRRGHAPGTPGSRAPAGRRHARLLARRGVRARSPPAPHRRDAPPRESMARVRGRGGRRRLDPPPEGHLRPGGDCRIGLLVPRAASAPRRVRGDAAGDRPRGAGSFGPRYERLARAGALLARNSLSLANLTVPAKVRPWPRAARPGSTTPARCSSICRIRYARFAQ